MQARLIRIFVTARSFMQRLMSATPGASDGAAAAEAEIAALRQALEAAKAETRAATALLADLSHEMRTPLNAVIGFSGAMEAEVFGPLGSTRYAEYAKHIRASGAHLLDLVNSILDLSRIEADRFRLKRESLNIGSVALECVSMVRLAAEQAGLKLVAEIENGLPESYLDGRALRQILLNLLSNAVKFTSDGEIRLTARRVGEAVIVTVKDTGVGMSAEELAKLGPRFTAAQGAGVRGAKGAGLGLALAIAMSEVLGGALRLDSAPGEGVSAELRLPIVAAPARRAEPSLADPLGYADDDTPPEAASAAQTPGLTQLERIEAYRRRRAA